MYTIRVGTEAFVEVAEVETLKEARTIVKFLDFLASIKQLPSMISFYNDETEVVAFNNETGETYEYMDQDPSGLTDGVWVLT